MRIDWYWRVKIWSMPRSYKHLYSWGFGESVRRMKMREREQIELKNGWQWWSGVTGTRSMGEFTVWTTHVSVLWGQHTVCGRRDKCVRAHANVKQYVSINDQEGKVLTVSGQTCVYMWARVCLCAFDGWAGRARPRIRVQTNWVINESNRGAVMGPTPRPLMHADQQRQPFVLEKWGSCHWDEETAFILKRRKGLSLSFPLPPTLFLARTHKNTLALWIWAQWGTNQGDVGC